MAWVRRYDMAAATERPIGLDLAKDAVRRGELVVLPTDTVYGLGTDAFSPDAVGALLAAKGRGRDMPVPVLVGSPRTLDGIATGLSLTARHLVEAFWPGGLTVVAGGWPERLADDTPMGPTSRSSSIATGCSGIRIATVPRLSPRSQVSVDCARQTSVSAPGQKASTRSRTR